MTFAWPLALVGLTGIPLVGLMWWRARHPTIASAETSHAWTATDATGRSAGRSRLLPMVLTLTALAALIVGLARPSMTLELPRVEGTVVFAIDNSTSMLADDASPTRIDAARAVANAFVDRQPATVRVGVVSFSTAGAVLQGPTDDADKVRAAIDRLTPGGGTAMGQGLFMAVSSVVETQIVVTEEARETGDLSVMDIGWHTDGVVVMISDGEDTEPLDVRNVAGLAANAGIKVFTIGVGTVEGAELEADGFLLATNRNDELLADIATVTGGQWFEDAAAVDVDSVFDQIDLELTARGEEIEVTAILAGVAALLLVIAAAISMRRFGRVLP